MNLGAFAVVIAVARRTRSGEIDSYSGLGQTSPGLAVAMTVFLLSLAGIPPTAGWFAKFVMFRAVFDATTPSAIVLGVIAAVDAALYGDGGFFTRGQGAGRRGRDFVTSPEVGALYGALVARALDGFWDELDRPDPYLVVDAGAGRGRLAADVLASAPRCGPALRYVLVERSDALRAEQREMLVLEPFEDALGPLSPDDGRDSPVAHAGPIATSLGELPAVPFTGVVLANELLDNLPFRVVERRVDGWSEVRVGVTEGRFEEDVIPATVELAAEADRVASGQVPVGARLPVPTAMRD